MYLDETLREQLWTDISPVIDCVKVARGESAA